MRTLKESRLWKFSTQWPIGYLLDCVGAPDADALLEREAVEQEDAVLLGDAEAEPEVVAMRDADPVPEEVKVRLAVADGALEMDAE